MDYQIISAISKRPGEIPRHVNVSNRLESLQRNVGGYIETVTGTVHIEGKDVTVCVICDEEGRLKGKEPNCVLLGHSFVGDILIVGVDGDEFTHIPMVYREAKQLWPYLWEVDK